MPSSLMFCPVCLLMSHEIDLCHEWERARCVAGRPTGRHPTGWRQGNDTARAAGFIRPGAIFCAFCTVWLPCLVARCHFHVLLTYIKCSKFVKCTFLSVFADARHITIIKVSTHKIKKKKTGEAGIKSQFSIWFWGFVTKKKLSF